MADDNGKTAPVNRIDYIEFKALDIQQTKDFYGPLFGWTFEDFGEGYSAFDHGAGSGGFTQEESVSPGGPLVVLYSEDLEATQSSIEEAGGKIALEIFSFPGGRRFHFTDPSGNELAVWSDKEPRES